MKHLLDCFEFASQNSLFDPAFYSNKYSLVFSNDIGAFLDYIRKSSLAPVLGSPKTIDCMAYREMYGHFLHEEDRILSPIEDYYLNQPSRELPIIEELIGYKPLSTITPLEIDRITDLIAINLHLYYPDLFQKFRDLLEGFPYRFDLYISVSDEEAACDALSVFSDLSNCGRVYVTHNTNIGRNFRSLLIDFRDALKTYDYIIHLHGKKSLYAGSAQTGWLDYLLEFLLIDKQILSKVFSIFKANPRAGLFYPVFSQYFNPPWVCHTLKNDQSLVDLFNKLKFKLPITVPRNEFLRYPVGSMFIARRRAISPLLAFNWQLSDFPTEPIPNDGTVLHAIERSLDIISNSNGYFSFQYHPLTGSFANDSLHIFQSYYYHISSARLKSLERSKKTISFDIFDTLVTRANGYNDEAKGIVGSKLLNMLSDDFIRIRNEAELALRIKSDFTGDVNIYQIYEQISTVIKLDNEPSFYADKEFEFDLALLVKKDVMCDFLLDLSKHPESIWYISDMYYTKTQIISILQYFGFPFIPENVLVSSDLRKRKENSTMWQYYRNMLASCGIDPWIEHVHIGDNVCSDIQNSGDNGICSYHVMGPMDYLHYKTIVKDHAFQIASELRDSSVVLGTALSVLTLNPLIP